MKKILSLLTTFILSATTVLANTGHGGTHQEGMRMMMNSAGMNPIGFTLVWLLNIIIASFIFSVIFWLTHQWITNK